MPEIITLRKFSELPAIPMPTYACNGDVEAAVAAFEKRYGYAPSKVYVVGKIASIPHDPRFKPAASRAS